MSPSPSPQLPAVTQPSLPYIWLPSVVQRLAELLPPNEVALTLRLVDKATAQQLCGPQHATVHLSQPVPHRDFVRRWAGPGAMRCLTRKQRLSLRCLVARSGSIANLEVLLAGDEAPDPRNGDVLIAAAGAGQKAVVEWLSIQHPFMEEVVELQRPLCGLLLETGWWDEDGDLYGRFHGAAFAAAPAAAEKGHVGLMEWLLSYGGNCRDVRLLEGAAAGLDLPTLRRLKPDHFRFRHAPEAPASDTADWQAKVNWLLVQQCPLRAEVCEAVASRPDALPRLQRGNVEALQYVLDQSAEVAGVEAEEDEDVEVEVEEEEEEEPCNCWLRAAAGGHVAVMELLHTHGVPIDRRATLKAAMGGHLPALAWLVERLGAATALTAAVFAAAASSGRMELLVWLRERGCPWDKMTFALAANSGSEEQIEWLAAQGCPMEVGSWGKRSQKGC
ncbi:hypothetical protein TSOC_015038 [Tetrabaena socialis]|uniref:Ankyrin repeat domain-containing protein n=1 Tax=Tetrabaena socialis TaxID=47790 RepID=A0A2J7ZG04_9CHLO|nr:hypothetical protein TSOC_015038 [Tetrabaena socialis]|eukprot:PNG99188.1 hypothetical protein TSOC_015038 [Tetrabaena socialis]